MSETFRIVLRDADGFEGFDSRAFDLPLGSKFPIGRASKNTTKKVLMPAPHNAYIDSPVISREHAVLSAEADNGAPHVFITDAGSMHGTMVNGQRLMAHTPKQLSSGDMLQFGIDVNRNEEFFVARKYTFEAQLARPQAPFSLGFAVPDSEEEEVGGTPPRRGSQSNPLTLDESDSESDTSDNEQHDVTLVGSGFIVDDKGDDEPPAVADIHLRPETKPETNTETVLDDIVPAEVNYSENEGSIMYYSSDMQEDDLNSEASVMGESEVAYDSDMELPNIESDAASDHDDVSVPEPDRSLHIYEQTNVPTHPFHSNRDLFSQSGSYDPAQLNSGSELPPMNMLTQTLDSNMFSSTFPPPLPPRPSAVRLFGLPPSSKHDWFSEEVPTYLGTNHGDRPSLFSPAPVPSMAYTQNAQDAQDMETAGSLYLGPSSFTPTANRMQTPPPMPTSDAMTSTPPPNRRTKVSITEIVEDQPPTPTSVNSMKRKADVLEEVQDLAAEELAVTSAELNALTEQLAVQTAAIIAQRPKKQPRSILSKVRTTATYFGIGAFGAAGAVALLSSLPDAFFV